MAPGPLWHGLCCYATGAPAVYNHPVRKRGLAFALLLLGACDKLPARQLADFSQAAIEARIAELRADVEHVLGSEIGPITVHVSTADTLAEVLAPELEMRYASIEGGARGDALKAQCRNEARAYSRALLAKVETSAGHMHVCPENFERMAQLDRSWVGIQSPSGLDVILIHEMTHVWQERHYGLEKVFGKPKSIDELLARASVIEGHAQYVARAVAERRGLGGAFDLFVRMQTEVPDSVTGRRRAGDDAGGPGHVQLHLRGRPASHGRSRRRAGRTGGGAAPVRKPR